MQNEEFTDTPVISSPPTHSSFQCSPPFFIFIIPLRSFPHVLSFIINPLREAHDKGPKDMLESCVGEHTEKTARVNKDENHRSVNR